MFLNHFDFFVGSNFWLYFMIEVIINPTRDGEGNKKASLPVFLL